ncbi:DMT family transporter [Pseudofrancisella aestuarii]|uniref:DMT family transporter n=1 Tax=Pseudofrancisella aestuarii TaxID=2670347 RepID=A0ABV9TAZ7_9GAMM|nr:DMT family transporter [Pseudofrancisella aestuarii]
MVSSDFKYYVKIFLAITFWASLYHIAPIPLSYVDLYMVAFIRYIFAAVILIVMHYFYTKTFFPMLTSRQWLYVFGVGFFGIFMYNIVFLWAEEIISGNIISIIYAFSPCLITVMSSYMFKNKISQQAKLGILVALVGAIGVVLFAPKNPDSCPVNVTVGLGEILSVLAVIFFSIYAVLGKCAAHDGVKMITVNMYAAVIGAIMFGIVTIFKSDYSKLADTDYIFWGSMLYIAIFATVVAYVWYLQSIEHLGVYKTAIFQNTLPFQTIIIGFILYAQTVSPMVFLLGGVVFLGVYITNVAVNKG